MQRRMIQKLIGSLYIFGIMTLFIGCTHHGQVKHQSSSVVNYLYPNKDKVVEKVTIPRLRLPLRVGIAFVPISKNRWYGSRGGLSENEKAILLDVISKDFKKYDFVQNHIF